MILVTVPCKIKLPFGIFPWLIRGYRELSGHLGRKEGGQHWAYANLWFLRLNIVETFRKHFPDVKNNLLVAREAIVTKIRLLCPQK